ncbi:MAG: type II secretion system GspH family protein [Planctomycetes bacterium]|nr:type II secretion system GspH family protein [Planctomycetota bacterium]
MKHASPASRPAFTIIEMLISIAIVLAAIGVVTQLFSATSEVVALSANTSQVINSARSISEQFDDDGQSMVGPTKGGILIIVNHMLGDTNGDGQVRPGDYNNNGSLSIDENEGVSMKSYPRAPEGPPKLINGKWTFSPQRRGVRSDQLLFIRARSGSSGDTGLRSITPATGSSFGGVPNATIPTAPPYARVWYGHVQRVLSNSTDPHMELGDDSDSANINRFGTNFILGRQAMMMIPASAYPLATRQTLAHFDTLACDTPIQGPGVATIGGEPNLMFKGTTDLAFVALSDTSPPTLSGPYVGAGEPKLPPDDPASFNPGTTRDYITKAYGLMYVTEDKRLRVNPSPDASQITIDNKALGQTHPYLTGNVSDFIVEFAADLNSDGRIDLDVWGNIKWYSHFPSATDIPLNAGDTDTSKSRFNVYKPGTYNAAPWGAAYPNPVYDYAYNGGTMPKYATAAFMWRSNKLSSPPDTLQTDAPGLWPYLIRIRYRVHDVKGRIRGNQVRADNVEFPNDNSTGRWFESIVAVNRN